MNNTIRFLKKDDTEKLFNLYKDVAKQKGGIARSADEINIHYINNLLEKSINKGIAFVIESVDEKRVIAAAHCHKLEARQFSHVLSDLTILVRTEYQGKGIGKLIFKHLLKHIEQNRKDILRLELFTRESNAKAVQFYENLGFQYEGKFKNRVITEKGSLESDIGMAWFNKNYSQ